MKNSHALILSLAALVVGLVAGIGMDSAFWAARSTRDWIVHTEVTLMKNLLVLRAIHAGRVDEARERLEKELDLDILTVHSLKQEHKELAKDTFSSLPAIFEYRSEVPYAAQSERVGQILKAEGERHLTTACTRKREGPPSTDCPSRSGEAGR